MKRLFDILFSIAAIFVLLPAMVLIAIFVKKKLGSPIFFKQLRPGKNGAPFTVIKFRTMRNLIDENGKHLPDEDRQTNFGNFLRSTSLDELPEFWNILKGEMSVVGPRPLLMEYLPLYSKKESIRHEVKPGLTGWAQINGRNHLTWEEKFELDVWYVMNRSFWLDLKIVFLTLKVIIYRKGINPEGSSVTKYFERHYND